MAQANPYPLRIDKALMEKFKVVATDNGRSVNKEIEILVRNAVRGYEDCHGAIQLPTPETDTE